MTMMMTNKIMDRRVEYILMYSWSELQVWQQGALVKHVKGLFKAEGISNAAEPGNSMHARLYVRKLIINPFTADPVKASHFVIQV